MTRHLIILNSLLHLAWTRTDTVSGRGAEREHLRPYVREPAIAGRSVQPRCGCLGSGVRAGSVALSAVGTHKYADLRKRTYL